MCGVAAAYAYAGAAPAIDRDELRSVRDHMAARGPDGAGEWFSPDGRVGLAHRRLAIIDLSERGAQPMASADGQLVISFNGEIYNYRELRAALQRAGRVFRTESDTEVLLQLYEEHGTAMLPMLRGMFALVLWDGRDRSMLLARDAFGIKPLYYADDGRTSRSASQVKALLRAPVDGSADPAGHAGFFLWGSVPSPFTLYRGIRELPAGHCLRVRPGYAEAPRPFCAPHRVLAEAASNPAPGSRQEALEAIGAGLADSVRAHMVADVAVGAFLSSGIDSGMICSQIVAQGMRPRTLTLGFREYTGKPEDEVAVAAAIARKLGTEHATTNVHREHFEAECARMLSDMDQPSIDGINTWFVAQAAAARGLKVAMSGLGGDELFASYPSFRQVPALARAMRPLSLVPGAGLVIRKLSEPLVRRVASPKYAGLVELGGSLGGAYLLRRGLYMPWELPRIMDPDMARDGWRALRALASLEETTSGNPCTRLAVSALESCWYMRHQLLRDADWAGMAHSVEIRVPLVDVTLLRTIAPWLAAHPDITKAEVAKFVAPELHHAWLRPKTGFNVPVQQWLGGGAEPAHGLRGWSHRVHEHFRKDPAPAGTRRPRVLISTLAPGAGGVAAMVQVAIDELRGLGAEPVLAHYAPYSEQPQLSVPSFRLLQRGVGSTHGVTADGVEIHGLGAWLPELEFTHYWPTRQWRALMDSCDAFLVASGNVLPATAFARTGRRYLAWVATDWHGDRKDRVRGFAPARRVLDTVVNGPVVRALERKLLRAGRVLPLSRYTATVLESISGKPADLPALCVGVDAQAFSPSPLRRVPGRLGFAGRLSDPRKNVGLLLLTLAHLRSTGVDASALLLGDDPPPGVLDQVAELGLSGAVTFEGRLARAELAAALQSLDVFVLPSHQEGLCIAALEAMACGVPVVSTRCGGPEEFVLPGQTGVLVDGRPEAMAAAVAALLADPAQRERLGKGARELVLQRYTAASARTVFRQAVQGTFTELFGACVPAAAAPAPVALKFQGA